MKTDFSTLEFVQVYMLVIVTYTFLTVAEHNCIRKGIPFETFLNALQKFANLYMNIQGVPAVTA